MPITAEPDEALGALQLLDHLAPPDHVPLLPPPADATACAGVTVTVAPFGSAAQLMRFVVTLADMTSVAGVTVVRFGGEEAIIRLREWQPGGAMRAVLSLPEFPPRELVQVGPLAYTLRLHRNLLVLPGIADMIPAAPGHAAPALSTPAPAAVEDRARPALPSEDATRAEVEIGFDPWLVDEAGRSADVEALLAPFVVEQIAAHDEELPPWAGRAGCVTASETPFVVEVLGSGAALAIPETDAPGCALPETATTAIAAPAIAATEAEAPKTEVPTMPEPYRNGTSHASTSHATPPLLLARVESHDPPAIEMEARAVPARTLAPAAAAVQVAVPESTTVEASPFASFSALNAFISALSGLPGVTYAVPRRFRAGTLQLAVEYTGAEPLRDLITRLAAFTPQVVSEADQTLTVTVESST